MTPAGAGAGNGGLFCICLEGIARSTKWWQAEVTLPDRHNVAMRLVRALMTHPTAGPTARYGLAGATVAGVYLAIPVGLSTAFGTGIEIAIPIAYVLAVCLHFTLQRRFVFAHVSQFALSGRQQAARYVMVGAIQYPTTALATALLPSLLGISARATFVLVTLIISVIFFLVLRGLVFHRAEETIAPTDGLRSQDEIAQSQCRGGLRPRAGDGQANPIQTPVQADR